MRTTVVWYAFGAGTLIAAAAAGAFAIEHSIGLPIARLEPPATATVPPAPAPATPSSAKPEAASAPAAAPALGFDVVRVEPTGETVVAGHAAPRAKVELRDDERALASATADDAGQFVILPEPLTPGSHRLRLAARDDKGVAQLSDAMQVDVAPPSPQVANAKQPEAPAPTAAGATALVVQSGSAAASQSAPAPTSAPSPAPPAAVAALQATTDTKSAPPASPVSANGRSLVVSSVKASDQGRLEAEGYAEPGTRLRLTLNGAFLAEVVAGLNGLWSLTIEHGMTPGLYTLEARQLGGGQGAHAQVSFAYSQNLAQFTGPAQPTTSGQIPQSAATALAAPTPDSRPSHATVAEVLTTTVAPGDNLWDLARRYYGDGLRYADIYSANATQIRNPNLIYIGQVFVVPHDRPRP